jgi:hypothetical protein
MLVHVKPCFMLLYEQKVGACEQNGLFQLAGLEFHE